MAKNMNNVPKVDKPARMKQKDVPVPPTGRGNPGSHPFGPGRVQVSKGNDGGTQKAPGKNRGKSGM